MFTQWKLLSLIGLFSAGIGIAATGVPGTINYVEGQVAIGGEPLNSKSVGSAVLDRDQLLETNRGKAEILLTPGVFLRVGDNSEVRMVSPELTNTQVALVRGEAMVEVMQLYKDNNVRVLDNGASTLLEKNGLYAFDADRGRVAVYDGKARVFSEDQEVELKKGREAHVDGPLQSQKFNRDEHDSLYAWSNLRSEYLSEASAQSARTIVVNNGFYGPGWYWNPWWSMYSFIPGDGFLYSPFGWGFYSPVYVYSAPGYFYHRPYAGIRPPVVSSPGRISGGHPMTSNGFSGRAMGGFSAGGRAGGGGFGHHR